MAIKTGLNEEIFKDKYTRIRGRGNNKYIELKEVRRSDGSYDCVFLDRVTVPGKALCSLYEARPTQCRTWPFWPELLESEKTWNDAKFGSDGCPGLGKGKTVSLLSIQKQLNETTFAREKNL